MEKSEVKKGKQSFKVSGDINIDEVNIELLDSKSRLINCFIIKNCTSSNCQLKVFLDSLEEDMIRKALKIAKGNQRITSRILGVKATTLNEKIKKYNISEFRDYKFSLDLSSILRSSGYLEQLSGPK